jgi:hypothetical protein
VFGNSQIKRTTSRKDEIEKVRNMQDFVLENCLLRVTARLKEPHLGRMRYRR